MPGSLVGRVRDVRGPSSTPGGVVNGVAVVLALVLGASMVAALAAKARAPAPSLLVVAGVLVALLPGLSVPHLTPDLVLVVVVPPLISAAAGEQTLPALRQNWRPIVFLAVALVLVSATVTALAAAPLLHVSGRVALVLGAILASTDPVAVSALSRRLRLPDRLNLVVQAESLANDATSLVVFSLAVGIVERGGSVSGGHLVVQLLRLVVGGALIGAVTACLAWSARSRTHDAVAHTVLAFVAPYAAYVCADALGAAGITAVVVAGVVTGQLAQRVTPVVRLEVAAVNNTVVFVLESVIFALIGLQLPDLVRDVHRGPGAWLLPAAVLAVTVVAVRLLGVQTLQAAQYDGARQSRGDSLRTGVVMTWAGTRGVIPIAAALSLPLTLDSGQPFPARSLLLLVTTSVSILTLVVQGLTLAPITRRAGVNESDEVGVRQEEELRSALAEVSRARLAELSSAEAAPPGVLDEVEGILDRRENAASPDTFAANVLAVRLDLLAHQRQALDDLHRRGRASDEVWRATIRYLDVQTVALEQRLLES